jgi:arsenate reductase (thioredoxin)
MTRVLFLCIGNSCRSQMAEGFARTYGSDVMTVQSAGLAPASLVAPLTREVMLEKNIDLGDAFPKSLDLVIANGADLIINMSGQKLPSKSPVEIQDWDVRDPIGQTAKVYREVRDEIEQRVMRLILALRMRNAEPATGQRVDTRRRPPRQ